MVGMSGKLTLARSGPVSPVAAGSNGGRGRMSSRCGGLPEVNRARLAGLLVLLVLPFLAGCNATPMTYEGWKEEQAKKVEMEKAGLKYKSPSQIRAEAEEMQKAADEAKFKQDNK